MDARPRQLSGRSNPLARRSVDLLARLRELIGLAVEPREDRSPDRACAAWPRRSRAAPRRARRAGPGCYGESLQLGAEAVAPRRAGPPAVPSSKAANTCCLGIGRAAHHGEHRPSHAGPPRVEGLPQLRPRAARSRRGRAPRRRCRPTRAGRRRDGHAACHASSLLPSSAASAASSP